MVVIVVVVVVAAADDDDDDDDVLWQRLVPLLSLLPLVLVVTRNSAKGIFFCFSFCCDETTVTKVTIAK